MPLRFDSDAWYFITLFNNTDCVLYDTSNTTTPSSSTPSTPQVQAQKLDPSNSTQAHWQIYTLNGTHHLLRSRHSGAFSSLGSVRNSTPVTVAPVPLASLPENDSSAVTWEIRDWMSGGGVWNYMRWSAGRTTEWNAQVEMPPERLQEGGTPGAPRRAGVAVADPGVLVLGSARWWGSDFAVYYPGQGFAFADSGERVRDEAYSIVDLPGTALISSPYTPEGTSFTAPPPLASIQAASYTASLQISTPPTPGPTSPLSASTSDSSSSSNSSPGLAAGHIVAIVLCSCLAVLTLALGALWFRRRKRRRSTQEDESAVKTEEGEQVPPPRPEEQPPEYSRGDAIATASQPQTSEQTTVREESHLAGETRVGTGIGVPGAEAEPLPPPYSPKEGW